MEKRSKKLLSDITAFTISNFASKFLIFLMVPLYTHVLAAEEFGIADLITSTLNILSPLLTLAIVQATIRFLLDKNADKGKVLGVSLAFAVIGLVILLVGAPLGKRLSPELGEYWNYLVAIYFLAVVNEVQTAYIRGQDKIRLVAIKGILHTAITITLNILFLLVFRTGVHGYLMAIVLSDVLIIVFGIIASKMWTVFPTIRFDKQIMREMLKYSIPMIPTLVAWWVMNTSNKYVIIAYCGLAMNGLYAVATKIPSIMTIVSTIFNQAWQISAVQTMEDADYNEYIKSVYKTYFVFNVFACCALICASELMGKMLFSGEYFQAWIYVPVLLVAFLLSGLSGGMQPVFTARKRTLALFYSTVGGAVMNLVLNFLLIPTYGPMAAAASTVLGFLVTFLIRNICVRKFFGIKLNSLRECMILLLIAAQAIVMCLPGVWRYPLQAVAVAGVLFVCRRDIQGILEKFKPILLKIVRRKKS